MIQTEPGQIQQEPPPPPAPPGRRMLELPTMLQYIMLPGAAAVCLQCSLLTPGAKILGSAIAAGAFWIGFARLNPHLVRLLLVICVLLSAQNFPAVYVALMACSALAGGVGALLTARDAEEDEYFFLPAMALGFAMLLLISLGIGGGWPGVMDRTYRLLAPARAWFMDFFLALRKADEGSGDLLTRWFISGDDAQLAWRVNLLTISNIVVFWVLVLWLAGRLVRRLLGRMRGVRPSLIVFRIRQRFIFLLILGLVLEIFSSLGLSQRAAYLAWPILGVCAFGCWLNGMGILLFLAAIRRMAGQHQAGFWLGVLGVATSLIYAPYVAVFGLADVWFDFRKLERLRRQIESGTDEPEE